MKTGKFVVALLVLVLSSSLVFAQGAIEKDANEKLIQVISLEKDTDGGYQLHGRLESGNEIIYLVPSDIEMAFSIDDIKSGMYLYVKDNGIMTMSIPAQSPAIGIRNVTLAVKSGVIESDFAPIKVDINISNSDFTDLFSRFSYAYGYLSSENFIGNGVYFKAGYYARGILDAWRYGEVETLYAEDDMYGYVTEFINKYQSSSDVPQEVGEVYATDQELYALAKSDDLHDSFSYSYGYMITLEMLYQGYDIIAPDFASGALAALYGIEPEISTSEMENAMNEYNEYLQKEYEEYMAELAKNNLTEANAILEENGKKEGVATLDSGVQILLISQDSEPGARPTDTDSVVVDYTLTLPDGTIADQGEDVTFSLESLIPGFVEAVMNMQVGDTIEAYIPPELGYGESGAGEAIEPNKLLIFTIYLKSIVE